MNQPQPDAVSIRIVIPDTGPLISLAKADALGALLTFSESVRIVITDYVEFEATRHRDKYPDAQAICDFLASNLGRVEIEQTNFGQMVKQAAQMRERYDESPAFREVMREQGISPPEIPPDAGELSIVSFANSLIESPPGTPILILAEDDYFLRANAAAPGNAHIVSTRAFLETLEELGNIPSAESIWADVARNRAAADKTIDRPAGKIRTNWQGSLDAERIRKFKDARRDRIRRGRQDYEP